MTIFALTLAVLYVAVRLRGWLRDRFPRGTRHASRSKPRVYREVLSRNGGRRPATA